MDDLISRQKVIDTIEKIKRIAENELYDGEVLRTFNDVLNSLINIISLLPSAQPEPCEDAVSRQDVISLAWSYDDEERHLRDAVEALPSVTPKQRTGKWIKLDMHIGMADHKCTACEQECYVPTCMGEPMYAFCPNCGAKMEVTT